MDEMHSEGLVTSKLRPKPEDCYVDAKNVTAFWNKVNKTISILFFVILHCFVKYSYRRN